MTEKATVLATVVVIRRDGRVDVTRLVSDRSPDLSCVDRLARVVLAARRAACRVRFEDVSPVLVVLLELTGLHWLTAAGADDSRGGRASYHRQGGTAMPVKPLSKPTIQVRRIHTVGVPVSDQDRALRFYVDTLGFETKLDVPIGQGKRWITVAPPIGTATMALVASSDTVPAGIETGIRLTSTDVDADHAALEREGVDVDDVLNWEGVPPMFAFRDPDGNGLELVGEA